MDKKDFLHHPALQFISSAHTGTQDATPPAASTGTPSPTTEKVAPTPPAVRAGVRNRRVQILLEPGLYEHARAEATKLGISFNEYLHRALKAYTPPQEK